MISERFPCLLEFQVRRLLAPVHMMRNIFQKKKKKKQFEEYLRNQAVWTTSVIFKSALRCARINKNPGVCALTKMQENLHSCNRYKIQIYCLPYKRLNNKFDISMIFLQISFNTEERIA